MPTNTEVLPARSSYELTNVDLERDLALAATALLFAKLLKNATFKVFSRFPHRMCHD
jgi:hypothetical protein